MPLKRVLKILGQSKKRLLFLSGLILVVGWIAFNQLFVAKALDFTWNQTDWSGGINTNSVTGDTNTYLSLSSVDNSTPGQLTLGLATGWWDTNWLYRKSLTLSNGNGTVVNYQVNVTINTAALVTATKLQSDCDDIRFVDGNGNLLNYWLDDETACNTTSTSFWVKTSSLPTGTSQIYVYYGNPTANGVSNGDSTFEFFDDFAVGPTLDGTKWEINPAGGTLPYTVTGGKFSITGNPTKYWMYNLNEVPSQHTMKYGTINNVALEWKASGYGANNLRCGQWGIGYLASNRATIGVTIFSDGTTNDAGMTTHHWFSFASVGTYFTAGTTLTKKFKYTNVNNAINTYEDNVLKANGTMAAAPSFYGIIGAYLCSAGSTGWWTTSTIDYIYSRNFVGQDVLHTSTGTEEGQVAVAGTLESNILDAQFPTQWGVLTFTKSGSGTVGVRVRSGNQANLSDATAFASCAVVASGADVSSNTCVHDGDRYIQYQVSLSTSSSSPVFESISLGYTPMDNIAPGTNATNIELSGANVGEWTNIKPTISWTAGADAGVGIEGYCVALDEVPVSASGSSELDPVTSSGKFTGLDDGKALSPTICPYIVSGESIDLNAISGLALTSGNKYYFSIKAIDKTGNVWNGSTEEFQDLVWFKFDNTPPNAPSFISMPSNFIATKDVTITWPTSMGAAYDDDSGLAGLQYKIGNNGTWYGNLRNGLQDNSDLLLNNGVYITDSTYDYPLLQEGVNVIYFRALDNVGNASATISGALKLNTSAPGPVQNLQASPADNTQNSYSFSWDVPGVFSGSASNLTYCYTVNVLPTAQSCSYTTAGVTSVATDAYATQPGPNLFYVVAKDEAGNINYGTKESVEFTYSGDAPGAPTGVQAIDISSKDTQEWKLAIAWNAPTDVGAGISKYKVYRAVGQDISCSNGMGPFTEISTVLDVSYISTGLSQQYYSYCIRACDSANNCSAVSNSVSALPTGKYTSPANLVSGPNVSQISTRKAVASWSTERTSDSKVQYGLSSGVYFDEEISKSAQVTEHVLTLNNLAPGTTYYYRAKWTDEDGNTGVSGERTFTTAAAPEIYNVEMNSSGIDYALVKFSSMRASKVRVYYGKTSQFGGVKEFNTSIEEAQSIFQLGGLEDGTKYYFKINPFDLDGYEYEGTVLDFTTKPRPRISNVTIEEIKGTAQPTMSFKWDSNTEISSIATVNPVANTNQKRDIVNVDLKTEHSLEMSDLLANTRYTVVIRGVDKYGNEAKSSEYTFTTATDSRPPQITNLNAETAITNSTEENNAQIIVSWTTDELATSQVVFGEGISSDLSQSTVEDKNLKYNHVVVISNLSPAQVYSVRAVARDSERNEAKSTDNVVVTPSRNNSALELVLKNLSDIFGLQ